MSPTAPDWEVTAVRYATRKLLRSSVYYRWDSYGEPDGTVTMSYYFWLLRDRRRPRRPPVVVDTGFDPVLGARLGRECLIEPAEAMRELGVDPASVELLVLTHLHYDHIGNVQLFGDARIAVSGRELSFWADDPIAGREHFAHHTQPERVRWVDDAARAGRAFLVGDEDELAPGLRAIRVGGHAPGQLVLVVEGADGRGVVLASDAVHYYDELERQRPFAIFADLAEVYRAYDVVRELSERRALVVGHDPHVMERFEAVEGPGAAFAVRVA